MTGKRPYWFANDIVALSLILAGKTPDFSLSIGVVVAIPHLIQKLLEQCWSRDPAERPSVAHVHDALSRFRPLPLPLEEPPHPNNHQAAPTPSVGLLQQAFEVAGRHIHDNGDSDSSWVDEMAEVVLLVIFPSSSNVLSQNLTRNNLRPGVARTAHLRDLCGLYGTVPTSYKLEGIVKEGNTPQCTSEVTEVWKGRYNGKLVAIKVIVAPQDDHRRQSLKSVSSHMFSRGGYSSLP